jgi:hypothetical protein
MDLAKRLNEELAAQQAGSLDAQRPLSPDTDAPRSRSYDQHKIKGKCLWNKFSLFWLE